MSLMPAIVNGISIGAIYGLIAMGLTLIFGIMRVINFAQGALLMFSMMISYGIWTITGVNPYILIIIVGPIMFCFGYIVEVTMIRPVLKAQSDVREPLSVLLLTASFAVVLENLALMIFGGNYRMAQSSFSDKTYSVGDVFLSAPRLYGLIIALVVSLLFYIFLKKTEIGRQLRATGQDRNTAALMGINAEKTFAIAFGLGTALLSVAGLVLLPFYYVHPTVGEVFMTRAFIVVILGGLGSVPGALVGGIIIGLIETVGAQFMTASITSVLIYLVFLIVLFVKPSGLFGSPFEW
ncbi:branched-chain amino acid ABC transporter permease [Anaerovorax odorimutans]|uniref:branched-chain amino acid ABC transporter permease n=1 Tax=Anaerovorax odorimutans TaxID=109327 RepID=UPI0003FE1202|nr:branched-chain amino acid ABC transporter permease [Anaerovorax odorimutans]